MVKTRKSARVAWMQAHRPPSPSPSQLKSRKRKANRKNEDNTKRKASRKNEGGNKRKVIRKIAIVPEKEVTPWKVYVKGGQNRKRFVSSITGMPFNPADNLGEIAIVPFIEKDFPQEIWMEIFLHMDAATATVFSYTNRFWLAHSDKFKKGKKDLYDPQSFYNHEKPFPVPLTYWYLDHLGGSVWLRGLIESIMVSSHIFDPCVGRYRLTEEAEEMFEAHRQDTIHTNNEIRMANEERVRELHERIIRSEESWSNRWKRSRNNQKANHTFRSATIQEAYDAKVEAIEEANEERASRRRHAYEQLMNGRDSDDEDDNSLDDLDPDDMSNISSDEEIPDPDEFMIDNNFSEDEATDDDDDDDDDGY